MIRNECDIVRDIIPNYIEGNVRSNTKELVEEHIKTCKECREILEDLEKEKQEENNKKSSNEEIDYLKKYNLRMNLLKYFMLILTIFIIAIWVFIIVRYIKGQRINNILQTAYTKVTQIGYMGDNLLYEANSVDLAGNQISNRKYYYKDGKFKEVEVKGENKHIDYGIGPYMVKIITSINNDANYVNGASSSGIGSIIAYPYSISEMAYLEVWSKLNIIECSKLGIRNEMYNGKECYVIYDGETWEVWINKENMSVVMQKSDIGINTFNLTQDVVSDGDIEMPENLQTIDESLKPEEIEQMDEEVRKTVERMTKMQKDAIESYKMLDNAMIRDREDRKVY